jgi:hypothetical protein
LLDSTAARRASAAVAQRMAIELGRDEVWVAQQIASFKALAERFYMLPSTN